MRDLSDGHVALTTTTTTRLPVPDTPGAEQLELWTDESREAVIRRNREEAARQSEAEEREYRARLGGLKTPVPYRTRDFVRH